MKPNRTSAFVALALFTALTWVSSSLFFVFEDLAPGLIPRTLPGLLGVLGMPFVHLNWAHLWANTLPLIGFGALIAWRGYHYFIVSTLAIIAASGALLWCFGRTAFHVGASGLIFGYFGFLAVRGFVEKRPGPLLASLAVLMLYGGILYGLDPFQQGISWDGHLAGLVAGIVISILGHRA